jgi:membrane protein required for colicin V production
MTIPASLMQLNITDYIILSVIFVSIFISLFRGFLKELVSLIIWIVGFWVAMNFYTPLAEILTKYIANESTRMIVSFSAIFISVLIFGTIFGYFLSLLVNKSGIGGFDRLLGMVFGCARGILLVSIILLLISTTAFVQDAWWKNSILIPHFQTLVDWLRTFLPQKMASVAGAVNTANTAVAK